MYLSSFFCLWIQLEKFITLSLRLFNARLFLSKQTAHIWTTGGWGCVAED